MSSNFSDPLPPLSAKSADRILFLLKTRGSMTAADLGEALGTTGEAARQQLVKMMADGLVEAEAENRGVGRPAQLWSLTAAGHNRFPDAHADLTVQLIGSIRDVLGEAALNKLISAREQNLRGSYTAALSGTGTLETRIARLADLRSREGYMAEWKPDGDGYLLIENHCPVCAAATACQDLCQSELRTFQNLLGADVNVTRTEHIVSGARRCVYRISKAA